MISPSLHKYEQLRLNLVHSFHINPEETNEIYEKLTKFLAEYFQVKYCLITFLTEENQCFLSHTGTELEKTPRNISICAHAILEESGSLCIENLSKDVRFHDNPLVKDNPKIRFYASHVIQGDYAFPIANLCIIDDKPKVFSPEDMEVMKLFSNQILYLFERHKAHLLISENATEILQKEEEKNTQYSKLEKLAYIDEFKNYELLDIDELITSVVSAFRDKLKFKLKLVKGKIIGSHKDLNSVFSTF